MIILSEEQRIEAIRICEAIEIANAKLQQACKNILEILDDRPPARTDEPKSTDAGA